MTVTSAAKPGTARFGVYVTGLHDLDVPGGSYAIDMYVWWVSPDRRIDPVSDLQIVNGRRWDVRSSNTRTLPDGRHYSAAFVSATINHKWSLRRYPFDRHQLQVIFETPLTARELLLEPDVVDSRVSELVEVPAFQVGALRLIEFVKAYDTSFGLGQAHGDEFSRVVLQLEIEREDQYLVATLFIGLIVANLVSLLIYFVDVAALGVRATLGTTAILSAVGNMYTLRDQITPASRSLLATQLAVGTFTCIAVALLVSIAAAWLYERDRGQAALHLNWSVFTVTMLTLAGGIGYALLGS